MGVNLIKQPFMQDLEEWREVAGFEGKYFISNHGRLKSIGGKFKNKFPDGYITMGTIDSTGYRSVTMRDHGRILQIRAHSLVARAFIPNPENKPEVNHIDSNRTNNHVSNLEWVTHKENLQHAIRVGRMNNRGSNHKLAKLKEEDVRQIRELRKQGLFHKEIAAKFNVSRRQIGDVISGRNWGWLT